MTKPQLNQLIRAHDTITRLELAGATCLAQILRELFLTDKCIHELIKMEK